MSTDQSIEQEIQAKGLTAPRITPADIEANIKTEAYFTAADGVRGATPGGLRTYVPEQEHRLLTFCVLTLRNGFTVTGESAVASPENFDADLGKKIARQNAVNKVWPLMGYALREKLASTPTSFKERVIAEKAELDERLGKLRAFIGTPLWDTLTEDDRARLLEQRVHMAGYSDVLADRIANFTA